MMKLSILQTGFFHSDGGAMFGLLPKSIWERHYHTDNENICLMAMRCLLFKKDQNVFIFDTGTGDKKDARMAPYRFFCQKKLKNILLEQQIKAEEVTHIILSHLHFDHCGALTEYDPDGKLVPVFPNAEYYISKKQWEHHLAPRLFDQDAFFEENTIFLKNNPRLHLIEEDIQLTPEVKLELYDGHTPGQIVSFITTPRHRYVFAGDVIPLALNIYLEAISAFDMDAATSVEERIRLLKKIANTNSQIIYYHDAFTPYSGVKKIGERYRAIPAPTLQDTPDERNHDLPI